MQRDNGRRSFFRVLAGLLAVATNPVAASAPVDVRLYGRVRLSLIWCSQFRPTTAVRVWRDGRIIWTGLAADLPPVALAVGAVAAAGPRAEAARSEGSR